MESHLDYSEVSSLHLFIFYMEKYQFNWYSFGQPNWVVSPADGSIILFRAVLRWRLIENTFENQSLNCMLNLILGFEASSAAPFLIKQVLGLTDG
jgi:hypothetical protein